MRITTVAAIAVLCACAPKIHGQSNVIILCDQQATPNCFTLGVGATLAANFAATLPGANAAGVLTNNGVGTLTWTATLTNPMVGVGDLIRGGSAGAATRLAADTSNIRKFLSELSVGSSPTAPTWYQITSADIPPAGTDTFIQFNDGGSLAGNSALQFDKTTQKLSIFSGSFGIEALHIGNGYAHADAGFDSGYTLFDAFRDTNGGVHVRNVNADAYMKIGSGSSDPSATTGDTITAGTTYYNTASHCLKTFDSGVFSCSGGGVAAGSNMQIQYTTGSGVFAASSKFKWDDGGSLLGIGMGASGTNVQIDRSVSTTESQIQFTVGGNNSTTGSWNIGTNVNKFNVLYGTTIADYFDIDSAGQIHAPVGAILSGLTSSDVSLSGAGGLISANSIVSVTGASNASLGGMKAVAGNYFAINSSHTGSGTTLPIAFFMGATQSVTIDTFGKLLVNTTTSSSSDMLQVNGGIKVASCNGCGPDNITDYTSSRSLGTIYQSLATVTLNEYVSAFCFGGSCAGSSIEVDVSPTSPPLNSVCSFSFNTTSNNTQSCYAQVPQGWYYRVRSFGAAVPTIASWHEVF